MVFRDISNLICTNNIIVMEVHYSEYDFLKSLERIDAILNECDSNFEERDSIPPRTELTYTNGFYVNCTAMFVDICGSSDLTDEHRRPVLAKIYRSFISEMVALLKGCQQCSEINIHGDCVWGVFNTQYKSDIDDMINLAARANSLVNALNIKLTKKGYATYKVGIGIDYGRALMIKAGYNGSGISDVVWMGDVVNTACHLSGYGNSNSSDKTIMISDVIYANLNDENKEFFRRNTNHDCYDCNIVNVGMDEWCSDNS